MAGSRTCLQFSNGANSLWIGQKVREPTFDSSRTGGFVNWTEHMLEGIRELRKTPPLIAFHEFSGYQPALLKANDIRQLKGISDW